MQKEIISYYDFDKIDIRLGTIIEAKNYDDLKKPSILLKIDFGDYLGIKKIDSRLISVISKINL